MPISSFGLNLLVVVKFRSKQKVFDSGFKEVYFFVFKYDLPNIDNDRK